MGSNSQASARERHHCCHHATARTMGEQRQSSDSQGPERTRPVAWLAHVGLCDPPASRNSSSVHAMPSPCVPGSRIGSLRKGKQPLAGPHRCVTINAHPAPGQCPRTGRHSIQWRRRGPGRGRSARPFGSGRKPGTGWTRGPRPHLPSGAEPRARGEPGAGRAPAQRMRRRRAAAKGARQWRSGGARGPAVSALRCARRRADPAPLRRQPAVLQCSVPSTARSTVGSAVH